MLLLLLRRRRNEVIPGKSSASDHYLNIITSLWCDGTSSFHVCLILREQAYMKLTQVNCN